MKRRQFILASVLTVAATRPVWAQRARPAALGWLTVAPHPFIAGFRQGMQELGWIEGDNLLIDYRYADGHADRLPALADALMRAPIDLVVASGSAAVAAARAAITSLPVVGVTSDWPGVNFARPAGNVTGIALQFEEVAPKWVEVLLEAVPHVQRIGVLFDTSASNRQQVETVRSTATALGRATALYRIDSADTLSVAIDQAKSERATALVFVSSPIFTANAVRIAELVRRAGLPAIFESRVLAERGGLMSYGANLNQIFRRLAWYAHRILKGAKPSDLPIEQPTKFELVINLKTAKALGLTIPLTLLARADEVIE